MVHSLSYCETDDPVTSPMTLMRTVSHRQQLQQQLLAPQPVGVVVKVGVMTPSGSDALWVHSVWWRWGIGTRSSNSSASYSLSVTTELQSRTFGLGCRSVDSTNRPRVQDQARPRDRVSRVLLLRAKDGDVDIDVLSDNRQQYYAESTVRQYMWYDFTFGW